MSRKIYLDGETLKLDPIDVVRIVDNSIVYPSYKSIKNKEIAEVSSKLIFYYKCDSKKCKFPLSLMEESVDLKALGIKNTAETIVQIIDENQKLFSAHQCGGYVFQTSGKPFALFNDSVIPSDEDRFGLLNLSEIRCRLIHQYQYSKLQENNHNWGYHTGTFLLGAGFATIALKLLKI